MSQSFQVLVVDDDCEICRSLEVLLATAGLTCRCFGSAEEFLASDAIRQPACTVLDVRLPGMDGLSLLKSLQANHGQHVVIMITGHGDVPLAVEAMRAGAFHFVEKPFDPDAFIDVLEQAMQRLRRSADSIEERNVIAKKYQDLSPREKEVLKLLVEGQPTKLIAHELGISTRTAEHHRSAVMKKMAAKSLSHLVRMALDLGASP
jgi:FixJ family two-component response regulator